MFQMWLPDVSTSTPQSKKLVGHLWRYAIARRSVLAVQDCQIDGVLLLQFLQERPDNSPPRGGDGVADI